MAALLMVPGPAAEALAQENPGSVPAPTPAQVPVPEPSPSSKPRVRAAIPAQKDAEGSIAPNRFDADTVIKSKYTLDGKPLEVDPD